MSGRTIIHFLTGWGFGAGHLFLPLFAFVKEPTHPEGDSQTI